MNFDIGKITRNKEITQTEELVLNYIINNVDKVMAMGVRGIAKENYTSTSTIMRLAKKLGYTGFVDLAYHIISMTSSPSKGEHKDENAFIGSNAGTFLEYVTEQDISHFISILKDIKHKVIFIYATGFSSLIANYLNKKILVLGKKCIFATGSDSIGIFENNIMDIEALIVVSKSGETKMVLDKVTISKNKKIKVISFTNELENSISKLSDISFRILDINKLDDNNIYPNTFFPNVCMLIEYIIYKYYEDINGN